MSSSLDDLFYLISQQITTYFGLIILIFGLFGNIFTIIIFTSLKTFQETTCAFYLTIASFVNIFQLLAGLLSRILSDSFYIDLTRESLLLCKLRMFILNLAPLISLTCMSFASIDQFLSMTNRWRYFSEKRFAYRFIGIACIVWCLHCIPLIIYSNIYQSTYATSLQCSIANTVYSSYYFRIVIPILFGFLPILIRILFGLLAYMRVRSLSRRQMPIVRSRRDRQLTAMVLIEVVFDNVFTLIYLIYYLYASNTTFSNPLIYTQNQLISSLTTVLYYSTFAVSFYIYFFASPRFRRQFIHVFKQIYSKIHCQKPNQIVPQIDILIAMENQL